MGGKPTYITIGFKKCSTCKITKTLQYFHKQSSGNQGVKAKCKDCANAYNRKWHKDNRQHANEYSLHWQKVNPEKRHKIQRRYEDSTRGKAYRQTRIDRRSTKRLVKRLRKQMDQAEQNNT